MPVPTSVTLPVHPDLHRSRGQRPRIRIGIDIDGVLADTLSAYAAIAGRDYSPKDPATHPRDYSMIEDGWFTDRAELRRATATLHEQHLARLPVLEHRMTEHIMHLRKELGDVSIIALTSRTPHPGQSYQELRYATYSWLAARNLAVDKVIFTTNKHTAEVHYLLDDDPEVLTHPPQAGTHAHPIVVARDWIYNNPATAYSATAQHATPHRVSSVAQFVNSLAEVFA